MKKGDKIITGILAGVLLILAACLRLYNPFNIPLSYDELTAIYRTHYQSFADMIRNGVMTVDGHPAGIQVFLFYWTKLVGYTELYVKLPFIAFGILSVYYTFKLGKEWFNPTVGLISAAYIATLQYTIMHSQEIRPYASGLFFTLAMVHHWNRIVFKPEKRFDLNWGLYVLFSALCMYNHYFSLAFAGLVGLTGIFLVNKRYRLRYITAGIMIGVLFIPHLHVTIGQFTSFKGGLEWLGKPHNDFILQYLQYVFHFSPYVYAIAGALLCWGITDCIIRKRFPAKPVLISFSWFAITFLAAFFYSIYVSPLLQYRVLIFCFPFLLFTIFGLLPDIHAALKIAILALVCSINVFTLVHDRKHYELYYKSPIKEAYALTDSVTKTIGKNAMLRFVAGDTNSHTVENYIPRYYINRYHYDSTFNILINSENKFSFIDYLEDHPRKFVSYGCRSEDDAVNIPILLNYYPNLVKQYNFFGGNFYILTSDKGNFKSPYVYESTESFGENSPAKGWTYGGNRQHLIDSIHFSGSYSLKIDSLCEYGPTFNCFNLKSMISTKNDIIAVTAEIYPLSNNMEDVNIVASLEAGNKTIAWTSTPVSDYILLGEKKEWIKVYHAFKLSDVDIDYPNVNLKVYIWNKGRKNFLVDDISVSTIKGNPYVYGIQEKLQ